MIELLAALGGAVLTVNGAILVYVVRIERRLTRLETLDEVRGLVRGSA